jgi:hypothetical protein
MFLLCSSLLGCEPALEQLPEQQLMHKAQQGNAGAAQLLAVKRQQSGELDAALNWHHIALQQGATDQLEVFLQLKQRQHGFLATASYLEQYLKRYPALMASKADLVASYGLWSESAHKSVSGPQLASSCAITFQPVVQAMAGSIQLQKLQQSWRNDPQLSSLTVCFLPEIRVKSTDLQCSYQQGQRIQCQYDHLQQLVAQGHFTQLLVVAGAGGASYNNGILQLAENSSYSVFRHEFAHVLGFIDEYSLTAAVAKMECNSMKIWPNLLLDKSQLDSYLQHWQLKPEEVQLSPVESCEAAGLQAYAPVPQVSLMRSHEAQLPALYLKLMQKALNQPQLIMPVQYFYAYLARQKQDGYNWQKLMEKAAVQGYPDALEAIEDAAASPTAPSARD